jgi:hypothetical protein
MFCSRYSLLAILIDPVLCVVGFIENRTTLFYASLTNNYPPPPLLSARMEWRRKSRREVRSVYKCKCTMYIQKCSLFCRKKPSLPVFAKCDYCLLGFNNLTLGSNQRLEFLGDTVLQLITSDFLYKAKLRFTIFFLLCF